MERRHLLKSAAILAAASAAAPLAHAADPSIPVIDAHIHIFDPTRPGGVPWPEPSDTVLYHPSLPPRYRALSAPFGIAGAIAVECSSWLVDNFWLLDVVDANDIMLGFIGDLEPADPSFAATLYRLHRSPRFLGIRYGNLWNRDLGQSLDKPEFVAGLKLLAESGLVLETANQDPALIAATVKVSDLVPDLRIVIDHLPHAAIPDDAAIRRGYEANLHRLAQRPHVFVKGSEIPQRIDGKVVLDPARYKAALDRMWDLFGEDRIFFGSDWPNSDTLANFADTFSVARGYMATRSPAARQKYYWKNSIAVYRWKARTPGQSALHSS